MSIDIAQIESHRSALVGHCYRMLGSAFDAEDAVQETMVRAWQNLAKFEGRSSLRTWLYRIATNVCLDARSDRSRRARPVEDGPRRTVDDDLETRPRTHWLEPIPDAHALPSDANPHELTVLRQSIRLAFVAALQHLPPRQRAALILSEVLGWSAAEIADALDTSVPAINSALQRARATLAARDVSLTPATKSDALSDDEASLLDRYLDAFHEYDVDTLVSLLREDATLSMPPYDFWLQGPDAIRTWLLGRGNGCRGSRLRKTMASGVPAFAQYRANPNGGYKAWALIILELKDGRIGAWNSFLDVEALFPLFGLPLVLPG
ncbi:MAG TPA: sigma-70 family RNA polymerase sigma factor [Vicinamibacterales bacterium]|nr:sigma-70 family RNA polymerase sigma factor [Vicinamibacterales bacterium]